MWSLRDVISLSQVGKLKNRDRINLVESTESFEEVCSLLGVLDLNHSVVAEDIELETLWAEAEIISYWDKLYPPYLRSIENPPMLLYVRGTMPSPDAKTVGVVGTRSCTIQYGKPVTEKFVKQWTKAGCVIVSGLANGIDTIAHETTVRNNATTVAVIASGHDRITPRRAKDLADQIVSSGGAVISEHPPKTRAHPPYFPARNRIISAISKSVVVIESKLKGGGLITADFALKMEKPLWAIPGPVTSKTSEGTNALIASGLAKLLQSPSDLLNHHEWEIPKGLKRATHTKREQKELAFLENEPRSVDDIAIHWQCTVPQALSRLFDLEMRGLVQQLPGKRYVVM